MMDSVDPLTEIYLVRHGQSLHNARLQIAGQLDSELTEQGFEDARDVASAIGPGDFDVIYSSDLKRAVQTVQTIIEVLRLSARVIQTPLLRELDYGRCTNTPVEETLRFLNYKLVRDQRYPRGEGFHDLERRAARFLERIRSADLGKRILTCAHAGSIRMLVMLLDPVHLEDYARQAFSNRYLGRLVLGHDGKLLSYHAVPDVRSGSASPLSPSMSHSI